MKSPAFPDSKEVQKERRRRCADISFRQPSKKSVCRKYGVDPDHISKEECRRMTSDLNERSGYKKTEF